MKRTSLSLLAAVGAAMAAPMPKSTPAPAPAAAPVVAPAVEPLVAEPVAYAAPTTAAAAPAAPISPATNAMIQNNIALVGGINALSYVPHKYADQSFASFQWAGGSPGSAEFWAAFDTWAASFRTNQGAGDLSGFWLTPDLGVSATISLRRQRNVSDVTNEPAPDAKEHIVTTEDTVFALDGIEMGASVPRGDMHLYAGLRARSLGSGDFEEETKQSAPGFDTSFTETNASRNFRAGFTVGARTYASTNGSAWQAAFSYDYDHLRPSGEEDANIVHRLRLYGRWGQRKDVDGYAIAYGVNPVLSHVDAKATPDVRDTISLPPNVAIEIPLFQNWIVKGGATLPFAMIYDDAVAADDEGSVWSLRTSAPTGNVGMRYGRGRWAAEAVVSSAFLTNGPYFLSGATTGAALTQFALIANFD